MPRPARRHAAFVTPPPPAGVSARGRGFGVLELAASVAFLVILLGLMVSLARAVRAASADHLTRRLLTQLGGAIAARDAATRPVDATAVEDPLPDPPAPGADEAAWAAYARACAPAVRRLLGGDTDTDAWGMPLCYMPAARADVGISPGNGPFCFSAGPDGFYKSRDDNLYTYDELTPTPARAAGGGHGE